VQRPFDPLHQPSKEDDYQQQKADPDKNLSPTTKDDGGELAGAPRNASVDPQHLPSQVDNDQQQSADANNSKVDNDQQQSADANKNLSPSSNDDASERSSEIPGDILSRDPSSVQSPLKRKREEKASRLGCESRSQPRRYF
jgi:hypothetical protein